MKIRLLTLVLIAIFVLNACKEKQALSGSFTLIPTPQKIDIQGNSNLKSENIVAYFLSDDIDFSVINELTGLKRTENKAKAQVLLTLNEGVDLPSEGYKLNITNDKIEIEAGDQAGLLYGMMTLNQLISDAHDQSVNLPMCSITDFPLLAYRSIHLDIKHHMERKGYYYQLIDRLVSYKINGVIVELEDKIKYKSQPMVGSADAWTVEEWKELSEYAHARNIEISPLVQGLGHASFILKHDEYKHLRDDPESDWAFNPLDPETYKVQFDLYDEAIDATPYGTYLHIGGDEVHTTGRGSDKSPLELQLIWLNKVCQYAEAHGRTPIFWDDMPLKFAEVYHPMFNRNTSKEEVDSLWEVNEPRLLEFIDQFPKNCIYMRWNYQSPETYGNLKAMEWFTTHGFQVMGATAGQTRWVLMPQNQSNIPSIRSFALSSIEKGLDGLLLTLWDDDSPHFELYMRGILAFAEYSWVGDKRDVESIETAFIDRYFGFKLGEEQVFIDKLEKPVGLWKNLMVEKGSRNDLVKNDFDGVITLPDPSRKGEWSEKYAERLEIARQLLQTTDSISSMIDLAKQHTLRNRYTLDVYEQVNELIRYTAQMMLTLEAFDQPSELTDNQEALQKHSELKVQFNSVRSNFENVYGQTRILTKPDDYILDQDHHRHSANQTRSFDWQFAAELGMLKQLENIIPSN
ncbi:MAG: glycoside hydrolase family 20 zincin-like fold domain-containing protein [Bacteroidota bacterium]